MSDTKALLSVRNLRVAFDSDGESHTAVGGIDFDLAPGECLAIVGESGSGKSVSVRSLVGLAGDNATVTADLLQLGSTDLRKTARRDWRTIRGKRIGFVLQDALASLDPLRTIGAEIAEPLKQHRITTRWDTATRVQQLLASVGVPQPELRAAQYSHELSGGLRQRALIATAIAAQPDILIADEPTTALDATVQQQILQLLLTLKSQGMALLLVSHDLSVVAHLADRIAVMKEGQICETGPAEQIIRRPQHPYTRMLLSAIPSRATRGLRLGGPSAQPAQATGKPNDPDHIVLKVTGLVRSFAGPQSSTRRAVDDVSLTLASGETLGLVGESGSGKTTVARLVLGLEQADSGSVLLDGQPWSPLREAQRRDRRNQIQAVWQDPLGSFDPRYTVERLLGEALHILAVPRQLHREQAIALLEQVGLGSRHLARHPRHLSGGQRQRVAIARALAYRPTVLVCDEPVSALDVSIQAQVLNLLQDLQRELGIALLFISHDLGVIQHISDRVLVMKDGKVVEQGDVQSLFDQPTHPYTRQLINAVPHLDQALARRAA